MEQQNSLFGIEIEKPKIENSKKLKELLTKKYGFPIKIQVLKDEVKSV
jgi:hypothetical protein